FCAPCFATSRMRRSRAVSPPTTRVCRSPVVSRKTVSTGRRYHTSLESCALTKLVILVEFGHGEEEAGECCRGKGAAARFDRTRGKRRGDHPRARRQATRTPR